VAYGTTWNEEEEWVYLREERNKKIRRRKNKGKKEDRKR
jgi:hypothetical protein